MVKGNFKWTLHGQLIEKLWEGYCIWMRFLEQGGITYFLLPELQQRWLKVCCGSKGRDLSMVLGWCVHFGLGRHLLMAPVSSGPCGGLCSGGLFITALLIYFCVGTGPTSRIWWMKGDWRKWLMCRLSWCPTSPVPTPACWGYGCLWPSGSWDTGMAVTEGPEAGTRASDGMVTKSVVVHVLSWECSLKPRKTCVFFSFCREKVVECNQFWGICL